MGYELMLESHLVYFQKPIYYQVMIVGLSGTFRRRGYLTNQKIMASFYLIM